MVTISPSPWVQGRAGARTFYYVVLHGGHGLIDCGRWWLGCMCVCACVCAAGRINGIYKLDADVPEVNGKPHYVHESKDYFHLVWKKFGSSPFKWCIRPSATTSSIYVCSPNDAITGENSVFDLTSLDFAGASTVRRRRHSMHAPRRSQSQPRRDVRVAMLRCAAAAQLVRSRLPRTVASVRCVLR